MQVWQLAVKKSGQIETSMMPPVCLSDIQNVGMKAVLSKVDGEHPCWLQYVVRGSTCTPLLQRLLLL
jgi:hypothetical protein